MRSDTFAEFVTLSSSIDLDALVGQRVMGDEPTVYWKDSYANQRFETLEDALESMRDPYFQGFIPEPARAQAVLAEVREYPAYSTKIAQALEVVKRFSAEGEALHLRQKQHWWIASFSTHPEAQARTAAAAICLAALRVRGIRAELREEEAADEN